MVRLIPDSEPAPTIGSSGLSTGRDVWVVETGNFTAVKRDPDGRRSKRGSKPYERDINDPAPTLDTDVRRWTVKGEDWPGRRPATTIAGDPRVFQPGGHHGEGEQSQNAVRVTLQEASILQGFRLDYPWQGSRTKQFEQVGNAVPPLLAHAVITALLESAVEERKVA